MPYRAGLFRLSGPALCFIADIEALRSRFVIAIDKLLCGCPPPPFVSATAAANLKPNRLPAFSGVSPLADGIADLNALHIAPLLPRVSCSLRPVAEHCRHFKQLFLWGQLMPETLEVILWCAARAPGNND
jgi:hypothetical protein